MFDIRFLDLPAEHGEDGGEELWGETTLGDYRERFLAPLSLWPRERYERQWLEAARRFVEGAERTAFFTVAWRFWWTMGRMEGDVVVQEELIVEERAARLGPDPDPDRVPYELLDPVQLVNEDGMTISTWRVSMADVRDYVARREAGGA